MEKSVKLDYEIGEIVAVVTSAKQARKKAVVLGFEPNMLFDSVQCVKIMVVGSSKPSYTLSDRICKL
tara:strand:- start:143 stop:343 length:201 start_codon:yes stop_codon:yes gene_type:complete